MKTIPYTNVVTPLLRVGAHERHDFPGFHEDYLALHCLIRKYQPATFMEIGTSSGGGTAVICAAMEGRPVFSIENEAEIHRGRVGKDCSAAFTQLWGDSTAVDLPKCDGWFIDGGHEYRFVAHDSTTAIRKCANLIVWHDTQIPDVRRVLGYAENAHSLLEFFLVEGTRIAFAVRK